MKLSPEKMAQLVEAAQAGSAEAFGELYDALVDPIYRYIFYRVSSREDAEDLTEQVFLRGWEYLAQFRPTAGATFSSWLFRIAHNAVVDLYRERTRTGTVEISEAISDDAARANPSREAALRLASDSLRSAIGQLPENYQSIIILKFVNEFSNQEISAILGKPEGSIRVLQFRALARLREILSAEGGEETWRNALPDSAF